MSAAGRCANCGHGRDRHRAPGGGCVLMTGDLDKGFVQCKCVGFAPMPEKSVPLDRLVNATTIAAILGVAKTTVSNWQNRDDTFPKPLETPGVTGIKLWDVHDIIAWRDSRAIPSNVDATYVDGYRATAK